MMIFFRTVWNFWISYDYMIYLFRIIRIISNVNVKRGDAVYILYRNKNTLWNKFGQIVN